MFRKWLAQVNESPVWRRSVSFRGMRFMPPTLDRWAALQAHRFGLMGEAELHFFERVIRRNWNVADVGANQGFYTLYLSKQVIDGRVYAFEPDPTLFAALQENSRRNGAKNVTLFNAAVASQSAKLRLRSDGLNRGDNRIVPGQFSASGTIEVEATPLDLAIPDLKLDLLKVDVQGFELEVLRGAERLLQANAGLVILIEFWPYGLRMAGSTPEELLDLMRNAGFSLFRLSHAGTWKPFNYREEDWKRPSRFCNLIAARDLTPIGTSFLGSQKG